MSAVLASPAARAKPALVVPMPLTSLHARISAAIADARSLDSRLADVSLSAVEDKLTEALMALEAAGPISHEESIDAMHDLRDDELVKARKEGLL